MPRNIYLHQRDHRAQHKSGGPQYARSRDGQAQERRRTNKIRRSYKLTSNETAAADLDKIAASPPLHQDSKSPIADVSSPTEQARTSEGGDRNTSSAGHGRGAPRDEDLPARTTSTSNTKHQPEAGHSRHHPAEAICLPAKHPSSIDDKNRERGASSRRNMESSDSREHVAEDGKQPQRVPVLGL